MLFINTHTLAQLQAQIALLTRENKRLAKKNVVLNEQLNAALDGTGLCIWEQDVPTGNLKIYNQTFGSMCGYQPDELAATVENWKNNLHPEDKQAVLNALYNHLSGRTDSYQAIHRMLHKDGSHTWVSDRGRVIEYDQHGRPLRMMGTHVDITVEKQQELALEKYANLDPLTELLNRKAISQAFNELLDSNEYKGGAFLFIDLDDFKLVNDSHGHKMGDSVLISVAKILTEKSTKNSKIARFGGDEFIILCDSAEQTVLEELARSLLCAFQKPIAVNGQHFPIGLSIGICAFRRTNENFDHVFDLADKSMYKVKLLGKNNFGFWSLQDDMGKGLEKVLHLVK